MPADFEFEKNRILKTDFRHDEDAPFLYDGEDDGRLWDLLTTYVDGEATEAERAEVEAMLRSDAAYAQDFAFLQRMTTQVQSFGEVEPPAHLREAIFAVTTQRPTFTRRILAGLESLRAAFETPVGRYALPVGTFAAAALLAFAFWPRGQETTGFGGGTHRRVVNAYPPSNPSEPTVEKKTLNPKNPVKSSVHPVNEKALALNKPGKAVQPLTESEPRVVAQETPEIATKLIPVGLAGPKKQKTNVVQTANQPKRDKLQPNSPIDTNSGTVVAADYAPRPMMDKDYQRPIEVAMKSGPGDDPLKEPDFQSDDSSEPNAGSHTPAGSGDTPASGGRVTQIRTGKPVPANMRRYLSGADLRREREAATLGYDRSTVLSIERSEMTGNVVGRF